MAGEWRVCGVTVLFCECAQTCLHEITTTLATQDELAPLAVFLLLIVRHVLPAPPPSTTDDALLARALVAAAVVVVQVNFIRSSFATELFGSYLDMCVVVVVDVVGRCRRSSVVVVSVVGRGHRGRRRRRLSCLSFVWLRSH